MHHELAMIKELYLYPVKSMRGVAVNHAHLGLNGFDGDRRYAFVQQELAAGDGFPWATGREKPRMILYTPRFETLALTPLVTGEGKQAGEPPVLVQTPDGDEFEIDDLRLRDAMAREHGCPVLLLKNKRGNFDSQHVSLFSHATRKQLERESGSAIDPRQFRANLYVEPFEGLPFLEEEWVGKVLRIGERALVGVTKKDSRCMMINLDPETAVQNSTVLRTVARLHGECAGIYANVIAPGIVRVGDTIELVA